jgi:hypothetical protein
LTLKTLPSSTATTLRSCFFREDQSISDK